MSPTSVVTAPPHTTAPAAESNLGAAQAVAAEIVPGADLAAAPPTPESTFVVTYPLVVTESVFVAEPTPSSISSRTSPIRTRSRSGIFKPNPKYQLNLYVRYLIPLALMATVDTEMEPICYT